MKRRLAMLLPSFSGGGAERVALHLMNDWVRAGHEVDLVLVRAEGALLPLLPPAVRVVDLGGVRLRSAFLPLVRYLRESAPHALQASMWPVTILAIAARVVAGTATRVVVSEHSTLSKQYGGLGRLGSALLRHSICWFYPRADARVVVSHAAAMDLARIGALNPATIEVIYNPAPAPPPSQVSSDVKARWPGEGARILSVGRMSAEKNHALLIEAFALLRQRRPASLLLLGEGPLRKDLEQLAKDLGVDDALSFAGFVADPQPYYASADLFVLSSDFEGYPLVLVEALQNGLAIVSTDCTSGPREILSDGRYGALVPCGDALAMADAMAEQLSNPPLSATLRARVDALAGDEAFTRYLALMLGTPGESQTPAE